MSNILFSDKVVHSKSQVLLLQDPLYLLLKSTVCLTLGSVIVLSGCASKPTYQHNQQSSQQVGYSPQFQQNTTTSAPNYYTVQRGDTLSQIASRYNLDYREVGAINNLDSDYTIYVGQTLKLWRSGGGAQPRAIHNAPANNTAANNYRTPTYPSTPTRNTNSYAPTQAGYHPAPTPSYNQMPISKPEYNATANTTRGFGYPSNNPVIKNFNQRVGDMGMWFGGNIGDPVVASKGGQVLYSGNGLPEYGNLIMIKHDNKYITIYAHNDRLLVNQDEKVQAGQKIATMGRSGDTNRVTLQFQVRENGSPVDPRAVLDF